MRKRVDEKRNTVPTWLQMAEDEKLLFSGTSTAMVRNPLTNDTKERECVILTDKRLVTLCPLGARNAAPAVTTIPLSQIQAIQTTTLSWNTGTVIACVFLFLLYIIPGIVFLIYILTNKGPRVNVIAGILRVEVKFSPDSPTLLREFITLLNLYTSFK